MITCAKFTIHRYFSIETAFLCKSLEHFEKFFMETLYFKECGDTKSVITNARPYDVYLVIDTFVYVASDT